MPQTVKALTLHQPWASLIAASAKSIETRDWRPPQALIGQRLAIHAGKRVVHLPPDLYPEYNEALVRHLGPDWATTISTGAVLAIATLRDARQVRTRQDLPQGDELRFGEYWPGRWMWFLSDVTTLKAPIPARGYQGLWNCTIPDDLALPRSGHTLF